MIGPGPLLCALAVMCGGEWWSSGVGQTGCQHTDQTLMVNFTIKLCLTSAWVTLTINNPYLMAALFGQVLFLLTFQFGVTSKFIGFILFLVYVGGVLILVSYCLILIPGQKFYTIGIKWIVFVSLFLAAPMGVSRVYSYGLLFSARAIFLVALLLIFVILSIVSIIDYSTGNIKYDTALLLHLDLCSFGFGFLNERYKSCEDRRGKNETIRMRFWSDREIAFTVLHEVLLAWSHFSRFWCGDQTPSSNPFCPKLSDPIHLSLGDWESIRMVLWRIGLGYLCEQVFFSGLQVPCALTRDLPYEW